MICAGQEIVDDLEQPLLDAGLKVFRVGGAFYAGDLDANRAIDQGTRLGCQVETAKSAKGLGVHRVCFSESWCVRKDGGMFLIIKLRVLILT